MFQGFRHILEMIRFSHTIFALPFALLAAVMAWHVRAQERLNDTRYNEFLALRELPFPNVTLFVRAVRWQEFVGILVCMVAARSSAMAFNRLADRQLDAENPRTRQRHLPAGTLSVGSVAVFAAAAAFVFVAGTLLFWPNKLPLVLSLPVLVFLLAYSYTKRFTAVSHFWLGAALMLAPVATWIALRGDVLLNQPADLTPAVVLGVAVLLWVAGFDIIYACQDVEFDRQARLHSVPARLGVAGALRVAAACHFGMLAALAVLPFTSLVAGPRLNLGVIYWCGIVAVAVLLVYEHWLVKPDDLSRVNLAFFHTNAVVSIGLFAVTAVDLLL
jgi:4-hydroxybenzoate polyprenyltransferase